MPAREILTLQFGNYANYIGAHWWNIQETGFTYDQNAAEDKPSEICHDVLYRQGLTRNGNLTYTPRLLLVDLEGSLKHLPVEGKLYDNNSTEPAQPPPQQQHVNHEQQEHPYDRFKNTVSWQSSDVEVVAAAPARKHEFQMDLDETCNVANIEMKNYNFEESVESWVDFLYTRYHPRTVNVINDYGHAPDKSNFDTYSSGIQLWKNALFEDNFCDRIRQYVEECDYLQGFQIICDNYNGFAGLTAQCLTYLNDEYSRANLTIPIYTPTHIPYKNTDPSTSDSIRLVNNVLSYHQYSEQATLFIPLSTNETIWRQLGSARKFPHLNFASENLYQTSAILAAYLDTITLRYRLNGAISTTSNTLGAFCTDLNNYERRLAAAGLAVPFPMPYDMDLIDYLDKLEQPYNLYQHLTPNCQLTLNDAVQNICVRGIPMERLKRPREQSQKQFHMPAYRCNTIAEMLQMYIYYISNNSMTHVTSVTSPMTIRTPFPIKMFDSHVTSNGFINTKHNTNEKIERKVESIPCLATVQTSPAIKDMLDSLITEGKRIKIAKLNRFQSSGLEMDDYVDALEHLALFKENFDTRYEL